MQPLYVTHKDHDYVFEDGRYVCLHSNYRVEKVETDTMRNGEHDTYECYIGICNNDDPACGEQELEPEMIDYDRF